LARLLEMVDSLMSWALSPVLLTQSAGCMCVLLAAGGVGSGQNLPPLPPENGHVMDYQRFCKSRAVACEFSLAVDMTFTCISY
jgi:hypothetical protein